MFNINFRLAIAIVLIFLLVLTYVGENSDSVFTNIEFNNIKFDRILNNTREETQDNFDYLKWTRVQKARRKHMLNHCKKYPDLMNQFHNNVADFKLLTKYRLLNCIHAKVASSSWKIEFLMQMNLIKKPSQFSNSAVIQGKPVLQHITPWSTARTNLLVKKFHSYTTVRHPYGRIVSAYKNKIVDMEDRFFIQKGHLDTIKHRFGDLSFTSFVKNIIYESETNTMNGHWKTYSSRCDFCTAPVKYILKIETFIKDLRGLEIAAKAKFISFSKVKNKSQGVKGLTTQDYLDQLTPELKEELYKVYERDFELFDYDPSELQ